MKTTVITDQAAILRLLVEQGCTETIRPQVKDYPSATGLIPDTVDRRKWYVITFDNGQYSVVTLEDCNESEAMKFTIAHVDSMAVEVGGISIIDTPAPTPSKN